jgi:DNA-3-methyladenine glycosylase I
VAGYDETKIDTLLADAGIIRNRGKIVSVVTNARAILQIQSEFGSFDTFVWGFVDGKPIQNSWKSMSEIPTKTDISDKLSKALKKRGFKFIGSGICYSFMQAVGMVNDHVVDCFRHDEVSANAH